MMLLHRSMWSISVGGNSGVSLPWVYVHSGSVCHGYMHSAIHIIWCSDIALIYVQLEELSCSLS